MAKFIKVTVLEKCNEKSYVNNYNEIVNCYDVSHEKLIKVDDIITVDEDTISEKTESCINYLGKDGVQRFLCSNICSLKYFSDSIQYEANITEIHVAENIDYILKQIEA